MLNCKDFLEKNSNLVKSANLENIKSFEEINPLCVKSLEKNIQGEFEQSIANIYQGQDTQTKPVIKIKDDVCISFNVTLYQVVMYLQCLDYNVIVRSKIESTRILDMCNDNLLPLKHKTFEKYDIWIEFPEINTIK